MVSTTPFSIFRQIANVHLKLTAKGVWESWMQFESLHKKNTGRAAKVTLTLKVASFAWTKGFLMSLKSRNTDLS